MKPKRAGKILHLLGWKYDAVQCPDKKALVMGVPHTCLADFVIAWLYSVAIGNPISILIKEKFFFWPLGGILRKMGAIPLKSKEKGGGNAAQAMIDAFNSHETLYMGMAPEGTRKPVKRWRSGFHYIGHTAGISVYMGYFDWKAKYVTFGEKLELTDDLHADMVRMQRHYKKLGIQGRHPERFVFLDEVSTEENVEKK